MVGANVGQDRLPEILVVSDDGFEISRCYLNHERDQIQFVLGKVRNDGRYT